MREQVKYNKDLSDESIYSLVKIPRNKVQNIWHTVLPYLEMGMGVATELSMKQVIESLADESMQLWVVLRESSVNEADLMAAFLTAIERDKGEWVISLFALGGLEPKRWLRVCDRAMQEFAKAEDAVRVRLCGRRAWIRLLPDSFAITGVRGGQFVYERDVDPSLGRMRRVAPRAAAMRHFS